MTARRVIFGVDQRVVGDAVQRVRLRDLQPLAQLQLGA